ncbi:MAG TPA: POTRA domain-containing protein [Ignavibacteriales bacterium]|nr:POTRA domain-containing protein [Ignavibacteriales bacterium]
MKKYLFITYMLLSVSLFGAVQDSLKNDQIFIADSIYITGNNKTDADIILREMTFAAGDSVNMEILNYNKERIYSLSLFNIVRVESDTSAGINIINVKVEESWYIYAIPFADYRENTLGKSTYGIYFTYKNFRGRNETIKTKFSFGYDPSFQLFYNNPRLIPKENISSTLEFVIGSAGNKSYIAENIFGDEFSYKYGKLYLSLGKRFDLFNWVFLALGYEHYESPEYKDSLITVSGGRVDRMPSVGVSYVFDSRDLAQFPENGVYFGLSVYQKGLGFNDINHTIAAFDLRQYKKLIGNLGGKWRLGSRFTFGEKIPYYDRSYLGFGDKIRGYYSKDFEGKHYTISSIEFKYPILKEWRFSLNIPPIPQSLTTLRIGLYLTAFGDAGTTYDDFESLTLSKFYSGYGGGFAILFLPHNSLRVEYGFNEFAKGELIIETGFSF